MSEQKHENQACVPYFVHEGMIEHISHANRRMLIALLSVCVTFIITIVIFVCGYTTREKNWLDTMTEIQRPHVTEVQNDGVYEQPNP